MVISLDLSPELVAALDKRQVKRPDPPVWPFEKKHLKFSRLSLKERKQLEEYQKAMRAYADYPTITKPERGSRSAVVEELLRAGLNLPKIEARKKRKRSVIKSIEGKAAVVTTEVNPTIAKPITENLA